VAETANVVGNMGSVSGTSTDMERATSYMLAYPPSWLLEGSVGVRSITVTTAVGVAEGSARSALRWLRMQLVLNGHSVGFPPPARVTLHDWGLSKH
jgi:hypothetical protein